MMKTSAWAKDPKGGFNRGDEHVLTPGHKLVIAGGNWGNSSIDF
jgi:hypothetical protein